MTCISCWTILDKNVPVWHTDERSRDGDGSSAKKVNRQAKIAHYSHSIMIRHANEFISTGFLCQSVAAICAVKCIARHGFGDIIIYHHTAPNKYASKQRTALGLGVQKTSTRTGYLNGSCITRISL